MLAYRFLTEDDAPDFCHKVTEALSRGWSLEGPVTYAFDAGRGVMRCGQVVVKEVDATYNRSLKLGKL